MQGLLFNSLAITQSAVWSVETLRFARVTEKFLGRQKEAGRTCPNPALHRPSKTMGIAAALLIHHKWNNL